MIKFLCDCCGNAVEGKTSHLRLETLIHSKLDENIGLELIPLFKGGQASNQHICLNCTADLLVKALKSLDTAASKAYMQALDFHDKHKTLERDLRTSNEQRGDLLQQIKTLTQQNKELDAAIKISGGVIQKLNTENQNLIEAKTVDNDKVLQERVTALTVQLVESKENERVAVNRYSQSQVDYREMAKTRQQLETRIMFLTSEFDAANFALKSERDQNKELRQKVIVLEEQQARKINEAKVEGAAPVRNLTSELSNAKSEVRTLKNALAIETASNDRAQAAELKALNGLQALKEQFANLTSINSDLQERLQNSVTEIAALRKEKQQRAAAKAGQEFEKVTAGVAVNSQIEHLRKEEDKLKQANRNLEQRVMSLSSDLAAALKRLGA